MTDDASNLEPWKDPEVEARIVALVLGEASDFEREDLARLMEAHPELDLFRRRIAALHGMLGERDPGEAWKLSEARRERILGLLPAEERRSEVPDRSVGGWHGAVLATAACLMMALLATLWMGRNEGMRADREWVMMEPESTGGEDAAFGFAEVMRKELPRPAPAPPSVPPSVHQRGSAGGPAGGRGVGSSPDDLVGDLDSATQLREEERTMAAGEDGVDGFSDHSLLGGMDHFAFKDENAREGGAGPASGALAPFGEAREQRVHAPSEFPADPFSALPQESDFGAREEAKSEPGSEILGRDTGNFRPREQGEMQGKPANGEVAPTEPEMAKPLRRSEVAPATEVWTEEEPVSTFSLHVSDVSFRLAASALRAGQWPDARSIRVEEFVNAFDYGDPSPGSGSRVASGIEQAAHPFLQQRELVRIALRTAAEGRSGTTPLRLTLLLDRSGSMDRPDRREIVGRAFERLGELLREGDEVTLIAFAREARLVAEGVGADGAGELVRLARETPSEGGTNLAAALRLAMEKARERKMDGAENRIVLVTDGAANLGDAEPERLAAYVNTLRLEGIAFDAAGIGADGLNDEILEALTRQGDGRYYLLDAPEDADAGFARQLAGAFRPSAKNVKVQVEFNPERVRRYRLMGFEAHRLAKEDFRNDAVDAAELAAAEAGVAIYEIETIPQGRGDVGSVAVRFEDVGLGTMVERRWPIPYEASTMALEDAAPSMRLAGAAAFLGRRLAGEAGSDRVSLAELGRLVGGLPASWRAADEVLELEAMIQAAREITGGD